MFKMVGYILLTNFSTWRLTEPVSTDIKHNQSPTVPFAAGFRWLLDMSVLEGKEGQREVPLFSHPCKSTTCELNYMGLL